MAPTGKIACFASALCVMLAFGPAQAQGPARSQEQLVSSLDVRDDDQLVMDGDRMRVGFGIAPGAAPETVELTLSARPRSTRSGGRLLASINGGAPIAMAPRAEPFEARFALYSNDLRPGGNVIEIAFEAGEADGWTIDAERTRLRVAARAGDAPESLAAFEDYLTADFAGPRRVHLDTDMDGQTAALIAQGLALRLGEPAVLVGDPDLAEISIRTGEAADTTLTLASGRSLRLDSADANGLHELARAFASRRLTAPGASASVADIAAGPRLQLNARTVEGREGLAAFAGAGAPFGANAGEGAAVIVAADSEADRAAAYTVIARAALASGQAWTRAEYPSSSAMPQGRDLIVLGPFDRIAPGVMRDAPEELRAAARAAQVRLPEEPRRRRFGAVAHADDPAPASEAGIAALYRDGSGRMIGLIATPEGGDFAQAGRRLAHSALWNDLTGRAALWDARAVTAFGPAPSRAIWVDAQDWALGRSRAIGLAMMSLAGLMLLGGLLVNARSTRTR